MSPQAGGPTAKPAFTVAEVLRVGLPEYAREQAMPPQHWRVLRAIMACRTPELGGHLYQCAGCGERQFVPHSCRNRHCPTCQGANGYAWLEAQKDVLLPIPYFHVVFTLPHALNRVASVSLRKAKISAARGSGDEVEDGRGGLARSHSPERAYAGRPGGSWSSAEAVSAFG